MYVLLTGPSWHTAQWDHSVSLEGKRVSRHICSFTEYKQLLPSEVGIIGSAASAVQVVPAIASQVGELRVFQRTPNWFFPKMDPVYPAWLKQVFRWVPFIMTVQRIFFFYMVEGWAMLWLTKVLPLM